jgi:hypothetical protein
MTELFGVPVSPGTVTAMVIRVSTGLASTPGFSLITVHPRRGRSMTGAGHFCAIRSYLATAARHGTSALDALIRAAEGHPWLPGTA